MKRDAKMQKAAFNNQLVIAKKFSELQKRTGSYDKVERPTKLISVHLFLKLNSNFALLDFFTFARILRNADI